MERQRGDRLPVRFSDVNSQHQIGGSHVSRTQRKKHNTISHDSAALMARRSKVVPRLTTPGLDGYGAADEGRPGGGSLLGVNRYFREEEIKDFKDKNGALEHIFSLMLHVKESEKGEMTTTESP